MFLKSQEIKMASVSVKVNTEKIIHRIELIKVSFSMIESDIILYRLLNLLSSLL